MEQKFIPPIIFGLSTIASEASVTLVGGAIYCTEVYFLMSLGEGAENYGFYLGVMLMVSLIGVITALTLAALIQREIVVRDLFLLSIFGMLFICGFPFQFPKIRDYMNDLSQINPLRWSFEGTTLYSIE
jgi:hypothetical protein